MPACHSRRSATWAIVLAALLAGSKLAGQEASPPLPPPRPDAVRPPADQGALQAAPQTAQRETEPADPACLENITKLGVQFESRPPIADGVCTVDAPLLVSGLPDGVAVSPPALMTCPVAESLARWTLGTLLVEADRHFQTAPTKLLIGTSYECRNQRSGTKASEHAFANGVDVSGFEFHKRAPLAIGFHAEGSPEAAFHGAVQKGACISFMTVLGPGSDAAHGDHLHLDMRGRRGGYRICQ